MTGVCFVVFRRLWDSFSGFAVALRLMLTELLFGNDCVHQLDHTGTFPGEFFGDSMPRHCHVSNIFGVFNVNWATRKSPSSPGKAPVYQGKSQKPWKLSSKFCLQVSLDRFGNRPNKCQKYNPTSSPKWSLLTLGLPRVAMENPNNHEKMSNEQHNMATVPSHDNLRSSPRPPAFLYLKSDLLLF